jgi:hypothetical protein
MPALINTFLFVEPHQHYLDYGSLLLHDIIQANRQGGQIITELIADDANPDKVKEQLSTLQPILFCGIGHGNTNVYSVECTAVLFYADSSDLNLFKDKVVSLCSCLTAVELGPAIMDVGGVAYTGYKEEFWFFIGDSPNTTHRVQSPFIAEFQFVASLLQGKTTGDARADQMAKYDEELNYWLTGAGKDDPNSIDIANILEMNKGNSVFLGEGTVTPSPRVLTAGISPSIPFVLSFAILAGAIYKEVVAT